MMAGTGKVLQIEAEAMKSRSEDKVLVLKVTVTSDAMEVLYTGPASQKGKKNPPQVLTLYGLLGKLALEGYPNARVNYHTVMKDGEHAGGLDRWKVEVSHPKWWVANKNKKWKAGPSEPAPPAPAASWKDAAAALHDLSNVPNEFVMWSWNADLLTDPTPVVRLVQPALVWSKTMDLAAGTIFQFA